MTYLHQRHAAEKRAKQAGRHERISELLTTFPTCPGCQITLRLVTGRNIHGNPHAAFLVGNDSLACRSCANRMNDHGAYQRPTFEPLETFSTFRPTEPGYVETTEDITRRVRQRRDHRKLRRTLFAKNPHCGWCGVLLTENRGHPHSASLILDTLSCSNTDCQRTIRANRKADRAIPAWAEREAYAA